MKKLLFIALMAASLSSCAQRARVYFTNDGQDPIVNGAGGSMDLVDLPKFKTAYAQAETEEARNEVLQQSYSMQGKAVLKEDFAKISTWQNTINNMRSGNSVALPPVRTKSAAVSNYKEAVSNSSVVRAKLKNDTKYRLELASGLTIDPGQTSEELELETDGKNVKVYYKLFDPKTTKRWVPLKQRFTLSDVISIQGN